MCCEAVLGGSVRKRCVTFDLTVIYLTKQLCSSGGKIPVCFVRSTYGVSVKEKVENELQNAASLLN